MLDTKTINEKLNLKPAPNTFHDMELIAFSNTKDTIKLRLSLQKYQDDLNIVPDKNHIAILDGTFNGVNIKEMSKENSFDFNGAEIFSISFKNDLIVMHFANYLEDEYFDISFSFKEYSWNLHSMVSIDEYNYTSYYINGEKPEINLDYKYPNAKNILNL